MANIVVSLLAPTMSGVLGVVFVVLIAAAAAIMPRATAAEEPAS